MITCNNITDFQKFDEKPFLTRTDKLSNHLVSIQVVITLLGTFVFVFFLIFFF